MNDFFGPKGKTVQDEGTSVVVSESDDSENSAEDVEMLGTAPVLLDSASIDSCLLSVSKVHAGEPCQSHDVRGLRPRLARPTRLRFAVF